VKVYEYVAADAGGVLRSGTAWASSEIELDQHLESRGFLLTRFKLLADERRRQPTRLSRDELVNITNQLATVTGAGVPLVDGLAGIGARLDSRNAKRLIEEMCGALRAGESLSRVMETYPKTFPDVYRASVRAGEASGALDTVLARVAKHLEWSRNIRATTIQALIYPAILVVAILGLIAVLLYFVLPRIIGLFPGGRQDLPYQTRCVLAVSDFMHAHPLAILLWIGASVSGLVAMGRSPRGRELLDRLILGIPRLGEVARQIATSKFASTASILQAAGCDVFTMLDVSAATCGNSAMTAAFRRGAERVRRGQIISEGFSREPLVDSLLVQMVAVGEKAGDLAKCLDRLVQHLDEEVPRRVKRFLSLLEPAILLVAGVVVAFILLAALLPIFELYKKMG
jgi:general secretion pathway protein F